MCLCLVNVSVGSEQSVYDNIMLAKLLHCVFLDCVQKNTLNKNRNVNQVMHVCVEHTIE